MLAPACYGSEFASVQAETMKYQVTFRERTDMKGEPSENPPEFLEPELEDGVVLDAAFVQRIEPEGLHSQEEMDETENSFLSIGTEVWEYDIAEGREKEFEDAMTNSQMVIEYEVLDNEGELANL